MRSILFMTEIDHSEDSFRSIEFMANDMGINKYGTELIDRP